MARCRPEVSRRKASGLISVVRLHVALTLVAALALAQGCTR
jgi:hypothetical protein